MIVEIAVVPGDYKLKNTKDSYIENAFIGLREAALRRFDGLRFGGIVFVFEQDCQLFERFLPASKLHAINWKIVDEIVLSNYPAVIVPDITNRNKAKRLKIPSCHL